MKFPWRRRQEIAVNTSSDEAAAPEVMLYEESRVLRVGEIAGYKIKLTQDGTDLFVHLIKDRHDIAFTYRDWQMVEALVLRGTLEMSLR